MAEGNVDSTTIENEVPNSLITESKTEERMEEKVVISQQASEATEGMEVEIQTANNMTNDEVAMMMIKSVASDGNEEEDLRVGIDDIPQSSDTGSIRSNRSSNRLHIDTDPVSTAMVQPLGEATSEMEHAPKRKHRSRMKRTPTSKEMEAEFDDLQRTFDTILSTRSTDSADDSINTHIFKPGEGAGGGEPSASDRSTQPQAQALAPNTSVNRSTVTSAPLSPSSSQRRTRGKVAPSLDHSFQFQPQEAKKTTSSSVGVFDRLTQTETTSSKSKRRVIDASNAPQAPNTSTSEPRRQPKPPTTSRSNNRISVSAPNIFDRLSKTDTHSSKNKLDTTKNKTSNVFDRLSKSDTQSSASKKSTTPITRRTPLRPTDSTPQRTMDRGSSSNAGAAHKGRGTTLSSSSSHAGNLSSLSVFDRLTKTETASSRLHKRHDAPSSRSNTPAAAYSFAKQSPASSSRLLKTAQPQPKTLNHHSSARTVCSVSSLSTAESVFDRLSHAQTEASSSRVRPTMPFEPNFSPPRHHADERLPQEMEIRLLCKDLIKTKSGEVVESGYFTELSFDKLHLIGSVSSFERGVIDGRRMASAVIDALFARDFTPGEGWRVDVSTNEPVPPTSSADDAEGAKVSEETFIVEKKANWKYDDYPTRSAIASATIRVSSDKSVIRVDQYFFRITD